MEDPTLQLLDAAAELVWETLFLSASLKFQLRSFEQICVLEKKQNTI